MTEKQLSQLVERIRKIDPMAADDVQRIVNECRELRDREAQSMMLHEIEGKW